jgi:hypothetical protein
MNNATIFAMVALGAPLTACVTDSNRCFPGLEYSPQYDACLQIDDGGEGGAGPDAAPSTPDGSTTDGGAGTDGGSGLGSDCNGNGDCAAPATYCLKDPTAAATDPGICSIPQCTAAACGSSYACCDCSAAPNANLMAWPAPVCVPSDNETTLVAFGCKCL